MNKTPSTMVSFLKLFNDEDAIDAVNGVFNINKPTSIPAVPSVKTIKNMTGFSKCIARFAHNLIAAKKSVCLAPSEIFVTVDHYRWFSVHKSPIGGVLLQVEYWAKPSNVPDLRGFERHVFPIHRSDYYGGRRAAFSVEFKYDRVFDRVEFKAIPEQYWIMERKS